jgi:hypothetical protein
LLFGCRILLRSIFARGFFTTKNDFSKREHTMRKIVFSLLLLGLGLGFASVTKGQIRSAGEGAFQTEARPMVTAEQLARFTNYGRLTSGGARSEIMVNETAMVNTGWLYFHVTGCLGAQINGVDYLAFAAAPGEAGGSVFFTADPLAITSVAAACQSGNVLGLEITDSINLTWDAVYFFNHK